ncbi:MAG TPA: hypothetical protein VG186_12505 [Solirubrobacteraceae bacterium]|nr:hypothetical protein [Solirubrobacteraceae bacterium]
MRIVIGTLALDGPGGTESYCLTVARELDRLGHEVTLFADAPGRLAERAAAGGFRIAWSEGELPSDCDGVLANDAITAAVLAERYTAARVVYCFHSPVFDVQLPPLEPGVIDAVVVPSERFAARARALALDVPLIRLTQPIDVARFAPSDPPRSPPRTAVMLGNYLDGRRRDALVETWAAAGVDCLQVGAGGELAYDVRRDIAAADIVVGKARAALEGMACGKAVYVFDTWGGDGWVTSDSYAALEADNFAGLATGRPLDRVQMAADLDRYDPDMGWINRELVVTHHAAGAHVSELVEVLRGPAPRRPDSLAGPAASARLARAAWRAECRAVEAEREASALRQELGELAVHAGAHARALAADRDAWQARAREAERQAGDARGVLATRRVRAGLALGRCLDRLLALPRRR